MELKIYRSLWGFAGNATQALRGSARANYDGIEAELPGPGHERKELLEAVEDGAIGFIPLILLQEQTPREQLEAFRLHLDDAGSLGPDRIVMHTGKDFWPLADSIAFYDAVVGIEEEAGIRVAHETHRGTSLNTPWTTAAILRRIPELRLCCDFSHWVVVCERLLADTDEALQLAAGHAIHLHARVGSDQTPQVQDPSLPAVAAELSAFERWWDRVWAAQERAGHKTATMTPEYGPPPYQPLTDPPAILQARLSAICDWQAERARTRFAARASPSH